MKSLNKAAGGVLGALCFSLSLLAAAPAKGDDWAGDVELASCERECCGCQGCGGCSPGAGYCFSTPLSEELALLMAGLAKTMTESGFIYDIQATQFYQGGASGGASQEFAYGGKVDQFVILDSTKLGLWEGMTMILHAETRFGEDVNLQTVAFSPVNVSMLYPKEGEHDTAITGLTFAQAISEDTQVTFGKFNAVDLFYSLYPQTGRGINTFMNTAMVIPISTARVAPLSFMGAGVLKYNGTQPEAGILVYDTQNSATTSGFDDMFDNGANILGFWRFFTDIDGLPGSHMFGGIWSTGEFTVFDPAGFTIDPGQGISVPKQDGAYTLLYILEQTLWMDCCNKSRNISVLSQWGLADDATSPIGWSANVGVLANGFVGSRPHDIMGVGYFYTGISNDLQNLVSPVRTLNDVSGVELFYSAAVIQGFQLTADLQVVEPANANNDTAVVVGLRGSLGF